MFDRDGERVQDCLSSDDAFDAVYDDELRALSDQHWTPVAVAQRAAALLTGAGATRILDVGSGAGKFCIVGALCTDAQFVGVDRREGLVQAARRAAGELHASRATFIHANVDTFSFAGFDGFYLYNPFFEHISKFLERIDGDIERSLGAHQSIVQTTIDKLRAAPPRAAVVTFHGFGGVMPREYRYRGDEPAGNDRLALWVKA